MFSSYALRSWSPRVASLALMGAITVYVTGGGHITVGRIGWFVLARRSDSVGSRCWESLILPDDPMRSLAAVGAGIFASRRGRRRRRRRRPRHRARHHTVGPCTKGIDDASTRVRSCRERHRAAVPWRRRWRPGQARRRPVAGRIALGTEGARGHRRAGRPAPTGWVAARRGRLVDHQHRARAGRWPCATTPMRDPRDRRPAEPVCFAVASTMR